MTERRGPDGGFTLLEVVVAMTLLAAGIALTAQIFLGALRLSAGARDASESTIYARQRMEEALLVPNPAEGREQGSFGEKYRWELTTAFVPQAEETPYEEIRLRVIVRRTDGVDGGAVELVATRWRWREKNGGA